MKIFTTFFCKKYTKVLFKNIQSPTKKEKNIDFDNLPKNVTKYVLAALRDDEAAGSNPVFPTYKRNRINAHKTSVYAVFCYF